MSGGGIFDRVATHLDAAADPEAHFSMASLLSLSDEERAVVRDIMRADSPQSVAQVAETLKVSVNDVASTVGSLSMRGVIEIRKGSLYLTPIERPHHSHPGGFWNNLNDF
ncbi:MAG: hypothetical protein WCO36_07570 [Actinomycetes bacterium]|jgi:predicted transcriptional regulator